MARRWPCASRPRGVRAARPGSGELAWLAEPRTLLLDGEPYPGGGAGIDLIESVLDLISAYERWVEAREGREGRMQRGRSGPPDRRPVNALAETRRLQRLLQAPRRQALTPRHARRAVTARGRDPRDSEVPDPRPGRPDRRAAGRSQNFPGTPPPLTMARSSSQP